MTPTKVNDMELSNIEIIWTIACHTESWFLSKWLTNYNLPSLNCVPLIGTHCYRFYFHPALLKECDTNIGMLIRLCRQIYTHIGKANITRCQAWVIYRNIYGNCSERNFPISHIILLQNQCWFVCWKFKPISIFKSFKTRQQNSK